MIKPTTPKRTEIMRVDLRVAELQRLHDQAVKVRDHVREHPHRCPFSGFRIRASEWWRYMADIELRVETLERMIRNLYRCPAPRRRWFNRIRSQVAELIAPKRQEAWA